MVNGFKIKKYWIITFCMVLCSLVSFAQDLSDKEIGFDVARITQRLKEKGFSDDAIKKENALFKESIRSLKEILISDDPITKKSTTNKSLLSSVPQSEREALIALYNETNGPNWPISSYGTRPWLVNDENSDVSNWSGVIVTNGHVSSVQLNAITGSIPDLSALTDIRDFRLYNCIITGNLNGLQNLKNLRLLRIDSQTTSGSSLNSLLPLSNLTNLEELALVNCTFNNNNFPVEFSKLINLKKINLQSGSLSENFEIIASLPKLTHIILKTNFAGILPVSFSQLHQLEMIDMSYNKITDIKALENLMSLKYIIFNFNEISAIPAGFSNLPKLQSLLLSYNKITGNIPKEFSSLQLSQLTLDNNKMDGIIFPLNISKQVYSWSIAGNGATGSTSQFRIHNNKFRFIDFKNEFSIYKANLDSFSYSPQAKINVPETITKSVGASVDFKMYPDGDVRYLAEDTYQWFKNGIAITGATSRTYTISTLLATDIGTYICRSYHTVNPDMSPLILEREPIILKVVNCTPKTGILKLPTEQVAVGKIAKFSFEETKETVIPGEVLKYKWTITDEAGQTVNSITTAVGVHSFVFTNEGKYTVNLIVIGADGCEATFSQEVTILPEVQCLNENISFSFETTAPNLSYVWTATNAAGVVVNSSTASPSSLYNVSFATPGVYTITMTATDTVTQCFETFTKNVTIASCAPTNCMVHFNFNFKIPDTGQGFGGVVLNLDSRMNIANGVVDFLKANSNKKLFATTFDMTNKGVNAVMVNKEITVNPGDVYKVGTANEISNNAPTVIRIQDNSYSNTFSTLINSGILKNTMLKNDGIDVSFFIISEDNSTSSLAGARSAYQALLSSGKAKKVFFVFVNEGKFSYVKLVGLKNRKVIITPTQFLAEIMGSTPINYAETNSILNSDFVQFSKTEIANVGFKKVFNDFLQKGYDDVSSKCEDVESCTKKNLYTPEIKRLFLSLANKLKSIPAGNDANTYAQKELAALAPYTIDLKPIIYNFINTSSTISFSFSETSLENDVVLPKPASGSILDIDLSQYTDIGTKTPVNTIFNDGKVNLSDGFVRNIDFCVKELSCVSHVALVIDESGSIDLKEMNKIKKQLKGFVLQQAVTNEKIGSNIHISLTGMSDSDANTRTDFIEPIKVSTDPSVLNKLYHWIDDLGTRNGQTGVSAGSDYWNSGLDKALSYTLKPNAVIMITDGCQTANTLTLQTTMKKFNNAKGSSPDLPHLYVVGIENGFYVDKPSTGKIADRNEDPNYNTALQKRSLTAKVAARLTKSLQYLLGFTETEFPVSSISDFKTATYFGHDNFNLLASDETYISDKLADSDIVCGDSAIKDFCDDCFSFKPEPDHEYLLSAWVKEESFVQVKSYMNSAINIVFYRQKEALDIPGQIIATEIAVPSGEIIDGWQRIVKKIKVPSNAITIGFTLENKSASIPVYFDDIRIHPLKGSVKSFVYDSETFKLMSELDENNYSTFYEYDNEGGLVRVKKETAKGIKTIQETRSGNFINTKE